MLTVAQNKLDKQKKLIDCQLKNSLMVVDILMQKHAIHMALMVVT